MLKFDHMKTNMSKGGLITFAIILSALSVSITSINPVNGQMAGVLLFVNTKVTQTSPIKEEVGTKVEIAGKYPIGITISENFLKEGSEKIIQEIFINGKRYLVVGDDIVVNFKNGYYDVKGTLDTKTGIVTLSNAKFVGETFDGVREAKKTQPLTSKKTKKLAVFLLDNQNSSSQPFYPSTVNDIMFGTGKFKQYFNEVSYGRQSITGDVFGWFTTAENGSCPATTSDLGPFIAGSSIDLNNYTNILIITLCDGNISYGMSNTGPQPYTINGVTYNKTVTWVNTSVNMWNSQSFQMVESMNGSHVLTNLEHLLIHEFGHALGLLHAHGLSCEGSPSIDDCQSLTVGNYFDVMAYNTIGLHFNAWAKAKLGWFSANELQTITESGIYNIRDLASPISNTGTLSFINSTAKAYKIKPSMNSNKTPIWIEFRNGYGFDAGLNTPALGGMQGGGGEVPPYNIAENKNGIMVYKEGYEGNVANQLDTKNARLIYLRGAPNLSNENPYQVSLNQGQTYSEPRYGLTITTLPPINQNSRRFQVTMNPNLACTHLPPRVSVWGNNPTTVVDPGNSGYNWGVTLRIINMDYISCPNTNFTATLGTVPNGITQANFNNPTVVEFLSNLEPDDERNRSFSIFIGPNTAPGQYTLPIIITNTTSGLSTTTTFPLTVQ